MTLDELIATLPAGWRFHVGHTPHWYSRQSIPKHLRKRPFEAYVTNGESIGTKKYVFESSDGATVMEALEKAIKLGRESEKSKTTSPTAA